MQDFRITPDFHNLAYDLQPVQKDAQTFCHESNALHHINQPTYFFICKVNAWKPDCCYTKHRLISLIYRYYEKTHRTETLNDTEHRFC